MWVAGLFVVVLAGLGIAASALARRLEPFVREATARYLRERFEAEVEIGRLGASLPIASPMRVLLARGKGAVVRASVANTARLDRDTYGASQRVVAWFTPDDCMVLER